MAVAVGTNGRSIDFGTVRCPASEGRFFDDALLASLPDRMTAAVAELEDWAEETLIVYEP